jgi:hypothetical protein
MFGRCLSGSTWAGHERKAARAPAAVALRLRQLRRTLRATSTREQAQPSQPFSRCHALPTQASALGGARTMSTHCSGCGGAEMALELLRVAMVGHGMNIPLEVVSACVSDSVSAGVRSVQCCARAW